MESSGSPTVTPDYVGSAQRPRRGPVAWIGFSLAVVGLLVGFLGLFNPHGSMADLILSATVLLIPVAVISLVLWSPQSFETATKAGPSLNAAVGFPLVSLFIGNIYLSLENPWLPLIPATLVALCVGLLALFVCTGPKHPNSPKIFVLLLVMISGVGGYTGVKLADVHFDLGVGQMLKVNVLNKTYFTGRRSTTYQLYLSPWGPRTQPQYVTVNPAMYEHALVGEPVCITLHAGALGFPWFTTETCPTGWST